MTISMSPAESASVVVHREISIRSCLEMVWDIQVHAADWPSWQTDIAATEVDEAMCSGATLRWEARDLSATVTVDVCDEGKRILWNGTTAPTGAHKRDDTTAQNCTMLQEWTFEETESGVHVTATGALSGARVWDDAAASLLVLDESLTFWLLQLKSESEARM